MILTRRDPASATSESSFKIFSSLGSDDEFDTWGSSRQYLLNARSNPPRSVQGCHWKENATPRRTGPTGERDYSGRPKVLTALRMKGIHITSIGNQTLGENPRVVFIRFWAPGLGSGFAKSLRYVLDVDLGAISLPGRRV